MFGFAPFGSQAFGRGVTSPTITSTNYVYRGNSLRSNRYFGVRTDANLYKGTRGMGWA